MTKETNNKSQKSLTYSSLLWIPLIFFIISCDKKSPTSFGENLSGKWSKVFHGDTLDYLATGQGYPNLKWTHSYVIRTDSGNFMHTYIHDTLNSIEPSHEIPITEFEFETDSTGLIYEYRGSINSSKQEAVDESSLVKFEILRKNETGDAVILITPDHLALPMECEVLILRDTLSMRTKFGTDTFYRLTN